jgi:hypothetical protein
MGGIRRSIAVPIVCTAAAAAAAAAAGDGTGTHHHIGNTATPLTAALYRLFHGWTRTGRGIAVANVYRWTAISVAVVDFIF